MTSLNIPELESQNLNATKQLGSTHSNYRQLMNTHKTNKQDYF